MRQFRKTRRRLTGIVLANALAIAVPAAAPAAGFRLPDQSIAGLGAANAMVANPDEIGAMPYNPAAMAFHKGINVTAGVLLFWTYMDVTNAAGNPGIDVSRPAYAPAAYVSGEISDAWRWGVAFNAPFGLETNWRAGSFPAFTAAGVPFIEPSRSKIEMFNVNPNVSYLFTKPGDAMQFSVAGGLDYYVVRKAQLDSQGIGLTGKGEGLGWNAAAMARRGPWTFGLSYRSEVSVDIDGSVTAPPFAGAAATEVRFPAMTQAGVRLQASKALAVEFDVEHTGWSSFDRTVVTHFNPVVPSPLISTNDWRDSWTYRLGVTYDLSAATRLRAGYAYDRTPLNDARFSARLPDADRNIFSLGLSQNVQGWIFDVGYSYTKFDSRNYASAVPFGTYGLDPNGTNFFNGSYRAHVHVLGLGVTKHF